MTRAELLSRIADAENYEENNFWEMIRECCYRSASNDKWNKEYIQKFEAATNLVFEGIENKRTVGDGDHNGYVWRFAIDGQVFQVDGWYDSWNGTEWDTGTLCPIRPVEKTIIVYEKENN